MAASWPFARGEGYLLAIAAAALLCQAAGLSGRWPPGLAWGIALLGGTFLVRVGLGSTASAWTPLAAGALLLAAELGYWSFELDGGTTLVTGGHLRRLLEVALLAAGGAAAAELALDLAEALPLSGAGLLVLGALAASAPAAILLRLARR